MSPSPTAAAVEPPAASPAPDGSAAAGLPQNVVRNGFDAQGNPVAPAGQKKPFLLDPLLR